MFQESDLLSCLQFQVGAEGAPHYNSPANDGAGLSFDLTRTSSRTYARLLVQVLADGDSDPVQAVPEARQPETQFYLGEELLAIPEFSLNPLAQRLVSVFENVNFKDFLQILSAFSPKATKEEKLRFMFNFHDVDGDGYISRLDLEHVVRQRVGASLDESEMDRLLTRVMEESGSKQERLNFETFCACFLEEGDFSLDVDIPSDDEL